MTTHLDRRTFLSAALLSGVALTTSACAGEPSASGSLGQGKDTSATVDLEYATQFEIKRHDDDVLEISVSDGSRYLTVPAGAKAPDDLADGATVIELPLDAVWIDASMAMDFVRTLDAMDTVRFSGNEADDWLIEEAADAMRAGDILYSGEYDSPDYELLLDGGCDLAVESTMITYAPEVKEKLESLGIPVFVDYSTTEEHPLGRMEWIKLYGALLGREQEAKDAFDDAVAEVLPVIDEPKTGKTVAFFYINSKGTVNVRRPGDYIVTMIEMAGGDYVPSEASDAEGSSSSIDMDLEGFYAAAHDVDVLIYNTVVDAELSTLDDLLQKSELLADFKAVSTGNVWCCGQSLYQESMGLGRMITDLHAVLTEDDPADLRYLKKLV